MPISNNSGRIMNGYKKWLTNNQRKRLSGLYKGLRQSTADEMRDQYLDQRGSMNRVRDVSSSYGLGEGYRARKQMTFDRAQERYGRQLAMQADNAFQGEVVNAANATIKAENERRQKEYARRLKAAQNKRRAAQNKYNRDMAAYNEQQARLERLRSMKTPKTAQTWKAPVVSNGTTPAHVSPFSWQAHTLTQYTDTGTGNNSPKGGGKSGLIAAALLAGHTGKRLAKGGGTTKPRAGVNNAGGKISGKVGRYTDTGTGKNSTASPTQKMIGRPGAPNFETDPSFALPLEPQMQAQLDVQLKEYQAATPEQQEQMKLGAKDQYAKDVAQYAGAMERLNTLQRGVQQAQSIMAQFRDLDAKVRDTRYSPEQRRGFSQQLSGLQRQYASVMQQQRGASQEISGLQRYIQNAFPRINASRALLGGMGVKYSEDDIRYDMRQGYVPTTSEDTYKQTVSLNNSVTDVDKEFWKRAKKITPAFHATTGEMVLESSDRDWFEQNGYQWIVDGVAEHIKQQDRHYANFAEAAKEYLAAKEEREWKYYALKDVNRLQGEISRMDAKTRQALLAQGESITGLTMDSLPSAKDLDAADVKKAAASGGYLNAAVNTSEDVKRRIAQALGVDKTAISNEGVKALVEDEAALAFINYCAALGKTQQAQDFLFDYSELANAMVGRKIADSVEMEAKAEVVRTALEFMMQFGYGSSTFFEGLENLFSDKRKPQNWGSYMASEITQNKVGRGWSQFAAEAVDSATQSFGNNATALVVGKGLGLVGGAIGGIAAEVASHAPSALMGLSAAGNAKQQALREGYGAKAATMYGILNGISETVLQENVGGLVGFGDRGALTKALTNAVNSVKSPVARTLINQGLDILSEIGEEEFGNIVENINRSITLGEKRGLFDGFAEQAGETAVSTAISTILLNALHIPAQLRSERGYSSIAKASGMSLKDAKLLLETEAAITNGEQVDPKDLSRYNELTAVLTAAMPENVAKAIADGKMTVADWVTSAEGAVQSKLMGKLSASERTAVQTEAVDHTEKLKGKTKEQQRDYLLAAAPTGKVGSAYYTTTDGKPINIRNLNSTQKANYVLAQKCAKAFEGSVDVVIHDTLPVSNGAMVGSDGRLHIALDVTNEQGRESIAYWTLAHEAGHALKIADSKAWNEMFDVLTDYAKNYKDRDGKNLYDALVDSVTNQYKYDSNSDAFNDEMFSLIAERMVGSEGEQWAATLGDNTIFDAIANDRNASAKAKRGFLSKLKSSVEKLSRQFRDGGFSKERKRLAKIREQLTEAYKRINEAPSIRDAAVAREVERKAHEEARKLREQTERREGFREGLKAHDAEFNKQKEAREKKARDDALLEEILKGFEEEDRIKASNETGVYIDEKSESANPTMMSLRTWNNSEYVKQRDKTAEEMAKELGISVEKAKAYIDNVNSIAKLIAEDQTRLDYEAAEGLSPFVSNAEYGGSLDFSTICKKRRLMTGTISAIQKALRNSTLTRDEILDIRNMMKERGYEVSCGLCYVEGSRAKMGEYCAEFIKLFKKHNPNAEWVPDMYDVNTPDGAEQMRIEHPDVYKQYEYFWNHYGTLQKGDPYLFASQQKPKLFQKSTEYTDEILVKFRKSAKDGKVAEKNKNGGLRLQSFSDFEIIHLLDAMQAVTDMSRVGLAGQAYTKVPDFAWALGDTGVKINLSLISKGVDENGHIILDEVEGMPRKDAEALRNRYSDNVGTILVVFNDEQLKAAMADDFIDFIIPFHASQWNSNLYESMGLPKGTKDYTKYQNEKLIKQTYHEYQGRQVKDKATNFMPNEYWDFNKSGKENAEAYLKLCAENNKAPKFSNLLVDNGDGSWSLQPDGSTDGYWKLLIDFKMYNNDGKGVPQMPVQPNFNMEEAQRMLNDYKGGHENFPVAQDVVDDFIKNRDEPATRHQIRNSETLVKDMTLPSLAINDRETAFTDLIFSGKKDIETRKYPLPESIKGKWIPVVRTGKGTNSVVGYVKFSGDKMYTAENFADDYDRHRVKSGSNYDIADTKYGWIIEDYQKLDEPIEVGSRGFKQGNYVFRDLNGIIDNPNDNIRYQQRATDAEYMKAVEDGDKATQARIIEETAESAGYKSPKLYHGTPFYGFTEIDTEKSNDKRTFYVTSSIDTAGTYSGTDSVRAISDTGDNSKRGIYQFYANTDGMLELDAKGEGSGHIALGKIEKAFNYDSSNKAWRSFATMRQIADFARRNGYAGVIVRNVVDSATAESRQKITATDVYGFFNPKKQLKSADLITRDDNGNIIPPSKRFNINDEDIRYQQRDFHLDFNVPELDTKALHEAVKGGEGTVENRFEVKYEKTDSGFAVHITDKDSGKTYDRAETVTEGNAKAEAERAAAAVIRNIKRGKADSTSRSTAGIYIEPGANAARSSAVPVSYEDENGNIRRNSKVARTMIEAGWMTDEQAERFADQVHDGIMSYEPVTNAEAKAYAEKQVSEHPAAAQAAWDAMYNSFAIPSDKDLAVGYQLMANAANDGDFDMMLKLGTELREMMTKAGQAIQSMNLLKQMGAVADVYRIDQAVQKMNDDLMKAAKGYFISINPDLVEALLKTKPDTQEYDKALEALYKDVASQIKPSLSDALTEYRYLAMLFNPRTHIRNLVGNAVFMPAVAMKNVFGTIFEGIRYGGNSAMKTKALAYGKQYGQFAKEDWGKVKTTIKSTGNKYRDMMSDIDNYRNHFGKGLGWLDKLAKFNSKLLEGEDMLFKQAYYRTALAAELSAKKVNLNDLRAAIAARDSGAKMQKDSAEFKLLNVYEEARTRAIKEANINTYNDANKFARDLNAFSRGGGKLRHMMVEGLLPFKNTPANIVSRSIEYSPVGLINSVTREAVKLHKGQIGANEFFDRIARGLSGSAIFALGVWLAKAGVLVGPFGDDKEDKEKKRRGHQAFSIEIAGKSYTLDWMAPVCIPLFTGVALYEMLEKDGNGEHWSQYAMNALTGMLEPITKMSMLEGIENLIDSLAYSDSKLEDAAITVGTSYLTQFIPTLSGQFARTIDPYTRRTYSDKESMLPRLVDKFVQTVQKKIPGWNQSLQPYVNELGEAEKEDNLWLRIFDNFISPGFRSAISNTKLDKELERLGDPSIYPTAASKSFTYNKATYNLHADEYTAFATARGTTAGTLMNSLIDSKAYQGLTDLDQVKAQAKAIEYANAIAKAGVLNMRGILDSDIDWDALGSWVPKANEYAKLSDSPTALADYIAIKTYTDGMKKDGSSWFGNVADYTVTNKDGTTTVKWNDMKYDYLQSLNLSDKERLFLTDAFDIKQDAYKKAEAAVAEVPNLTVDAYTKALDHWQDLTLEKAQKKEALSEAEYEKWLAGNTNAFKKYLNDTKDLTGQQKFALLTKIGSSDGWEGKADKLRNSYGVSYDDAWKAAYKASTLTSTDEASKNAQYMAYLNSTKLDGKQKFGLYGSFGSSTSSTLEKATAFVTGGTYNKGKDSAAAFGKPSYDSLWNAYTAYNGGVQHEAFYDWLSKQRGMNAQQRFACCEFTNSTSAWMERAAEVNSKMGIGYDTLWKIKVYWRNESGQGKKARITAYCKKLGLRQSQVDKLYALKFLS